jgi:hypothetical protein
LQGGRYFGLLLEGMTSSLGVLEQLRMIDDSVPTGAEVKVNDIMSGARHGK